MNRVAAEGEAYFGMWSLQGLAGVEFGNSVTGVTGALIQTYSVPTRFTDSVNVNYYVNEDWKVFAGHRYALGAHALALGTELGFALGRGAMGAAFVEGRIGESNRSGVFGGLRFYFGQKDKSLIRRHREDDPTDWTADTLFTLGGTGSSTTALPPASEGL